MKSASLGHFSVKKALTILNKVLHLQPILNQFNVKYKSYLKYLNYGGKEINSEGSSC